MEENQTAIRQGGSYLPAFGFATAAAIWTVCYLSMLNGWMLTTPLFAILILAILLGGGYFAGKFTGLGWKAGAGTGLISSLVNLLILGSVIGGEKGASPAFVPLTFVAAIGLGALGSFIGSKRHDPDKPPVAWSAIFANVTALTTLLLLIAGGLVTTYQAGLAVPDWPNSFGANMFLFPVSGMTKEGGVFYEHSHRLFGTLVGLSVLVLTIHLHYVEQRRWVKNLSIVALVFVIVQGIMGGLRVTGAFTMSQDAAQLAPNLILAAVHGVFGQVVFGILVALAIVLSAKWKSSEPPVEHKAAGTGKSLAIWLIAMLFVQLSLGAMLRHLYHDPAIQESVKWVLHAHIGMGIVVLFMALGAGIRAWGVYEGIKKLVSTGLALAIIAIVQVCLGVGALVALNPELTAMSITLPTLHQATGAALLAHAVMLLLWQVRLVRPVVVPSREKDESHR